MGSLVVQADGKILAGGDFWYLDGELRDRIGRLNADGTLDSGFNPGANRTVYSLAVQADGKILVGGWFSTLGGQPRNGIGRLHVDGTLDSEFIPEVGGGSPYVNALVVQADGKILVGGWFSTLGGQARNRIGRLNADGTLDSGFNAEANNTVYSLALQADGGILVGGVFTMLGGQPCNRIGRLHADGTLDSGFDPGAGGSDDPSVNSLAVQANGKILVGGGFTTLGGQPRNRIGRLHADGTLDSGFNPGAGPQYSAVNSLAVQADGKILVGGSFYTLGGQPREYLGRLNTVEPATQSLTFDGSTITWLRGGSSPEAWRTIFESSPDGLIWTLLGAGERIAGGWQRAGVGLSPDDTLRARGFITGGQYNASGWFAEAFLGLPAWVSQPANRTNQAGETVRLYALAGGTSPLGYHWLKDGVELSNGGKVSGAGTPSLTLSNVLQAEAGDYRVVATNTLGSRTSLVARLTVLEPGILVQPVSQNREPGQSATFSVAAVGTPPLSYQWWHHRWAIPGATNAGLLLNHLQPADAGHYFAVVTSLYGSATSAVALLTVSQITLDSGFNPGAGGNSPSVNSLVVQADGKILVGGRFTTLGGQPRNYLGRLNADGTVDNGFNPGASDWVNSLAVQADGKILVGGRFTTLAGQQCNYLGRLNADGTLDSGFNPDADGYRDPWVYSLAAQADGKILVGGNFTTLGGQPRNYLGRLSADGTLDSGFNPGADWIVYSLAVQADGKILAGGLFTMLGGPGRNRIGRLHADGTVDSGFKPGANYQVNSLAVQADGRILVGGGFTTLGGQPRNRIGRLNADGTLDASFNPGANNSVSSLAMQADGRILVGGWFTTLSGQPRDRIGRLHADGTLDSGFNLGANGWVSSLAVQADGKIVVGGEFTTLRGQPRDRIGRLNNSEPATQSLDYDGATITWLRGGTGPEVWRTTFDFATDGASWTSLGEGTRIVGGWSLDGFSLLASGQIRARGHVSGGYFNGSTWFVESVLAVDPNAPPRILTADGSFGFAGGQFGFNVAGQSGQVVVVEASTNLTHWLPLATNTLPSTPFYFTDPAAATPPWRFYRARLQ